MWSIIEYIIVNTIILIMGFVGSFLVTRKIVERDINDMFKNEKFKSDQ